MASATILTFAALALGVALQLGNGTQNPSSLTALTVAVVAAMAWLAPPIPSLRRLGERVLTPLLGLGLSLQLYLFWGSRPGIYLLSRTSFAPLHFSLVLIALLGAVLLSRSPRWSPLASALVLATFFGLGCWLLRASPNPYIDVFVFHREALKALLSGTNPYAITMPNIYGTTAMYAPGLVRGGRVFQGYPYPPLSLFLALPGHLVGDYRYSMLVALTLAGGLLAYARPGSPGPLAATLLLFTPRSLFVLEQGWTEPLCVLCLALVVFCAVRAPRWLGVAVGLLIAVKQYLLPALPFAFLLLPRPWEPRVLLKFSLTALGVAAAFILPFALLDPAAYLHSTVAVQVHAPFRMDSLSYLAWYATTTGERLPTSLGFIALLAVAPLAWRRAGATPAGFAAAVAVTYLVFFAFSKQAFCNYYFFVVGALWAAVALADPPSPGADSPV